MKRGHVLVAVLSALLQLAACGDDDGASEDAKDAGPASVPDASMQTDAAIMDGAVPAVQVENVGEGCALDRDCKGSNATCELSVGQGGLQASLPGGYCTAMCKASAECGPGGGCPIGDLTSSFSIPNLNLTMLVPIPSLCLEKCDVKDPDACRAGYVCQSVRQVLPDTIRQIPLVLPFLNSPSFTTAYCIPPIEVPMLDAGVRGDAGTATDAGGMDAAADAGP